MNTRVETDSGPEATMSPEHNTKRRHLGIFAVTGTAILLLILGLIIGSQLQGDFTQEPFHGSQPVHHGRQNVAISRDKQPEMETSPTQPLTSPTEQAVSKVNGWLLSKVKTQRNVHMVLAVAVFIVLALIASAIVTAYFILRSRGNPVLPHVDPISSLPPQPQKSTTQLFAELPLLAKVSIFASLLFFFGAVLLSFWSVKSLSNVDILIDEGKVFRGWRGIGMMLCFTLSAVALALGLWPIGGAVANVLTSIVSSSPGIIAWMAGGYVVWLVLGFLCAKPRFYPYAMWLFIFTQIAFFMGAVSMIGGVGAFIGSVFMLVPLTTLIVQEKKIARRLPQYVALVVEFGLFMAASFFAVLGSGVGLVSFGLIAVVCAIHTLAFREVYSRTKPVGGTLPPGTLPIL